VSLQLVWGITVAALSLLAWGGQALSWLAPAVAERFGLTEHENAVEAAYHADIRGEAMWDTLSLWTMPVAGILLAAGVAEWAYFGLVGGGMYLYFAGRGVVTRVVMQRRGLRIGSPGNVRAAYLMLAVWGVMAVVVMVAAADRLMGG
jgi:hypothetical protein